MTVYAVPLHALDHSVKKFMSLSQELEHAFVDRGSVPCRPAHVRDPRHLGRDALGEFVHGGVLNAGAMPRDSLVRIWRQCGFAATNSFREGGAIGGGIAAIAAIVGTTGIAAIVGATGVAGVAHGGAAVLGGGSLAEYFGRMRIGGRRAQWGVFDVARLARGL